jgi:hypothetical protein
LLVLGEIVPDNRHEGLPCLRLRSQAGSELPSSGL